MSNGFLLSVVVGIAILLVNVANANLVKMCLFYKVAGHARTDPILSQECVSDHVHTFYGPQLFHPNTTNEDLRNSDPKHSTSVFEENKSLYWHPTIYKVGRDDSTNITTYELAEVSFSGPYYRWDKDAPLPRVEAFPKGFQMIAGMDPDLPGLNLFSECLCPKPCNRTDGLCDPEDYGNSFDDNNASFFPMEACGEMGIAMAFPTCWDDSKGLGDTGDHMSHMAYTVDGTVAGACPEEYNRRLPQIQLFVRISDYEGGRYTFSDNTLPGDQEVFHADFMNGWDDDVLEDIIENCEPFPGFSFDDYSPPCNCEEFLTRKSDLLDFDTEEGRNDPETANICPIDVRRHIVDEEIFFGVGGLPRGSCLVPVIEGVAPPFVDECGLVYTPNTFDEDNCKGGSEDEYHSLDWSEDEEEESGSKDLLEDSQDSEDESWDEDESEDSFDNSEEEKENVDLPGSSEGEENEDEDFNQVSQTNMAASAASCVACLEGAFLSLVPSLVLLAGALMAPIFSG